MCAKNFCDIFDEFLSFGYFPLFLVTAVESWPLMGSPAPLLLTFATYLLFVLSVGPRYMKDRKPMNLNFFTRGYNIFQVIACVYFISWASNRGINFNSTWKCITNRKDAEERFELDQKSWLFLMLRLIELVETVIFVLRKKQNQVSSLHIYHHLSTVVLLWSFLKYSPSKLKGSKKFIISVFKV